MSVLIRIIGADQQSDEYLCAVRLKHMFEYDLPAGVTGEILLHSNATLLGQTVKDIDILMIGTLHNYTPTLYFTDSNNVPTRDRVTISSFCTAIEIKSHDITGIKRDGTELYVKYPGGYHAVTTQSNKQKISVKNFFDQMVGSSPFVTNLIWFTGVSKKELDDLMTVGGKVMPSNVLPDAFSAKDLIQRIVLQKNIPAFHLHYLFDCYFGGATADDFSQVLKSFSQAKHGMGELTRKRIEQITSKAVFCNIEKPSAGRLSIYRGRAGTGKTVGLIQLAISLVDDEDSRVLILTYNRALVSDIRRLFALADLPDMFADSCVAINTMHSFFFHVINNAFYNGSLSGELFLSHYEDYLRELIDFLSGGKEAVETVREILGKSSYLSWDYCLIDEAQDWMELEQTAIMMLFEVEKLVVADGGQQFVRDISVCDWSRVAQKKSTKLKYCLRQKTNLIRFINHYLFALGRGENKILDGGKLPGGKVLICSSGARQFEIFRQELKSTVSSGNIPYDMLFLCPSSMVEKNPRRFLQKDLFEKNGIPLWDGTYDENRLSFSLLGDEARILQYNSARGLEAWTVICLEFDRYIEEKDKSISVSESGNSLLLESAEDTRLKQLVNWVLIPLTRAIDTIIITLADSHSKTAELLRKIAQTNPDYIQLIEE